MADLSSSEILEILHAEFGNTLRASRDEGLDRMAAFVAKHSDLDRERVEAVIAEMVDKDLLRYVPGPDGEDVYIGTLDTPEGLDYMEGAQPLHATVPEGQEKRHGFWNLTV